MDTPTGIQLPKELLPAIQEFLPGELIVIFLHADTRRRTTDQYIVDLTEWTRTNGVDLLYERTWGTLSLGDERLLLKELRESAVQSGRPMIVFYHFPQRFIPISYEADVTFHLLPGAEQSINVQFGKCRRAKTPARTQSNVVLNIPERSGVSIQPSSDKLFIQVSGQNEEDKLTAMAVIARAMKDRYPDKTIVVDAYTDNFYALLDDIDVDDKISTREVNIGDSINILSPGDRRCKRTIVINQPTEEPSA